MTKIVARYGLTESDLDRLAAELDEIRSRVVDDLGQRDVDYIRRLIRVQRGLEVSGRALLWAGVFPPLWLGGVTALSLSKILDNMEIGHNVMHGQYDWTNDPALSSQTFEWDNAVPGRQWRHSHNYMHHTYTNIVGKDRDVGYAILRVSDDQKWSPGDLANPLKALALAALFQYGVALHDLEVERIPQGRWDFRDRWPLIRETAAKIGRQTLKDYVAFPLLSGPAAPLTIAGNATANLARNLWAFTIIFCGHFPDGAEFFTEDQGGPDESRGHWYLRQIVGSSNISGGPLFHVMSGNLSHQIEHHVFPDLPAHRYAEVSGDVRDVCRRYGLPYNTGGLLKQFGSVVRSIFRLALPGGRRSRSGLGSETPTMRRDTPQTVPEAPESLVETASADVPATLSGAAAP